MQSVVYGWLRLLQRMWLLRPRLREMIQRVWTLQLEGNGRTPGPVGLAMASARSIGWAAQQRCCWADQGGALHNFAELEPGAWQHIVRDGIRQKVWQTAAHNRADLCGIEGGVDRKSTGLLLCSPSLLPRESRPSLRRVLSGAVWTQSSLFRCGVTDSQIIPHCGLGVPETLTHL